MSCDYASGLSDYDNKGVCGVPEIFDTPEELEEKINKLAGLLRESKHLVVVTGAGISTSVGIPDFRGPKGVWTLEKAGEKPNLNLSFDDAIPSKTHMALVALARSGPLKFILSQNVDGLHLKSGFPLECLTDLHGNMFTDKCDRCHREFIRTTATKTVGQKYSGENCPSVSLGIRSCRGKLKDSILDWEDELPIDGLRVSELHCQKADVVLCLGSTLQILPVGTLPLKCKKGGGSVVICNLQPTKLDKKADLIIRAYVDDVLSTLLKKLGIEMPQYDPELDPTKNIKISRIYPKLKAPTISKRQSNGPVPKIAKKSLKQETSEQQTALTNTTTISNAPVDAENIKVEVVKSEETTLSSSDANSSPKSDKD